MPNPGMQADVTRALMAQLGPSQSRTDAAGMSGILGAPGPDGSRGGTGLTIIPDASLTLPCVLEALTGMGAVEMLGIELADSGWSLGRPTTDTC